MVIQRLQSCCFASLFPPISWVSAGTVADWCEKFAQQISGSSSGTGKMVAQVNDESESKVAPTVVSILTKSPLINVPAQGNCQARWVPAENRSGSWAPSDSMGTNMTRNGNHSVSHWKISKRKSPCSRKEASTLAG